MPGRVRPRQRRRPGRLGGRVRRPVDGRRLGSARQLPGDHHGRRCCSRPRSGSCTSTPSRCPRPSARTSPPSTACRASTSTSGRRACRTSPWPATRRSATRASCRSCSRTTRGRRQASLTNVRGAHNLKAGVARGPADDVARSRATTAPGSTPSPRPPTNNGAGAGGDAAAAFLLGYPVPRCRAPTWWSTPTLRHLGAEPVRPGRLARHRLADAEPRACATTSSRRSPRKTARSPTSTSTRCSSSSPARTAPATPPGWRPTTATSRRASALRPRCAPGTVVRGGYGLSFFPSSMASNAVLRNTPFTYTFAATSAAGSGGVPNVFFSTPLPTPTPGHADRGRDHRRRRNRPEVELSAPVQRDGRAGALGRLGDGGLRRLAGAPDVDGGARTSTTRRPAPAPINPRRLLRRRRRRT